MTRSRRRPYKTSGTRAFERMSANLLLVLTIALLVSGLYGSYRAKRFNQRYVTATAVVTDVEVERRPRVSHSRYGGTVAGTDRLVKLSVRFPTDRGTVRARLDLGKSHANYGEGQTLTVLYDPERPRHVQLGEYERIPAAVTMTLMMAGVLLALWRTSLPDG